MARAMRESREQDGQSGSPYHGGLNLSQEGRIILPTTAAALSWLELSFSEAAVAICDTALAAAGGRDSPASADSRRVPSLRAEALARGNLGDTLSKRREEPLRS